MTSNPHPNSQSTPPNSPETNAVLANIVTKGETPSIWRYYDRPIREWAAKFLRKFGLDVREFDQPAAEVAQSVLLRLPAIAKNSYREDKGSFRGYLYRIVANEALRYVDRLQAEAQRLRTIAEEVRQAMANDNEPAAVDALKRLRRQADGPAAEIDFDEHERGLLKACATTILVRFIEDEKLRAARKNHSRNAEILLKSVVEAVKQAELANEYDISEVSIRAAVSAAADDFVPWVDAQSPPTLQEAPPWREWFNHISDEKRQRIHARLAFVLLSQNGE